MLLRFLQARRAGPADRSRQAAERAVARASGDTAGVERPDGGADLRWRDLLRKRVLLVLCALGAWTIGVEARLVQLGAVEGDDVLIGDPYNAVVFDFRPGVDAGVELLSRRGEDQRFEESRPAAHRRRAIQEAMPERAETETRADVARRLDRGPISYEIGSADDPDRPESEPEA